MNISSYSFYTSVGGYGIYNMGWTKYLTRLGHCVYCFPEFTPKPPQREWEILSDEEKSLFNRPFEQHKIGISGTTPFEFNRNTSEIKIAMTMAESDRIGEDWVKACNGMSHIIVPNEFYKNVFRDSGVTTNITVIPGGIDTEKFSYINRPSDRTVYTFGICGYLNNRKGVFDLIQAFCSEFDPHEDVRLLLHSTNPAFRYYQRFTDPRIHTTWGHKSFDELFDFYKSLDCFVFPSKAEGIGYPPREAMATGLPVILTEYSGLLDIAQGLWSYPLSVLRLIPRKDMIEQPGNWAEIDISELMYWMRHVYEHRDEAKKRGKLASIEIHSRFSWGVCAKQLHEFLQQHYD